MSGIVTFTLIQIDFFIKTVPSLLNGIRVSAFAWYSVKIRVIFGVRSERRKVDKKSKSKWKLKHANAILESSEYFCQISSKFILKILSYTVLKLVHFLRHSVENATAVKEMSNSWTQHKSALTNAQRKHSNCNSTLYDAEHVGISTYTQNKY